MLGVQHAPLGTGRLAFCGNGDAAARVAMERMVAARNFIVDGSLYVSERIWNDELFNGYKVELLTEK